MLTFYAQDQVTPIVNPQTLFQVSVPTGQRVRITGADITLQGSTPASTPIPFEWLIQTSAGTASSLTPQKEDRGADETIQATLLKTFTQEPTAGAVLIQFSLHQQASGLWRPPRPMIVKGGERVGLRYSSGTFVPVSFTIYLEE